jgi:predicted Zn-dependent protease
VHETPQTFLRSFKVATSALLNWNFQQAGAIVHCVGSELSRFALAILLGFASVSAFAQSQPAAQTTRPENPNLEADILLGAARNAVMRNDLKTAIERFQEFRKLYPNREDGQREYADALFRIGRVSEALQEYERLLAQHADDPGLIRSLVDAMLNLGDHPQAKRLLGQAIKQFPDRVEFAISLALLHALDEETAEAEELVVKSIQGRPLTTHRMQLDAASLYVQLKHPKKAGPLIDALLKSDPNDAKAIALSIRYAIMIGDISTAVRQADKLDRLYPGNVDLRLELASALYAAGDYAEAGRMFSSVLEKSPQNATALIGNARVAMRDYRMDIANHYLQQIPDDARGRTWFLAAVEWDIIVGDYFHGHAILNQLLQENPEDRQASMAMADLDRAENEFIKADARYQANDIDKKNSVAARHFALSLYLQRRYRTAEKICQNLLADDPKDSETNILLARILLKTDRANEAMEYASRSNANDSDTAPERRYFTQFVSGNLSMDHPNDARPIYTAVTLFDLAMEDGRRTWAKEILDEALQAAPDNIVLKTRLAEWYASFGVPCQACRAAKIYEELLAQDSSNQKWMLGLARAKVVMRCNDEALALYRKLRCESPDNYLYARENARVVFFVCGSPKGLAEYDAALCHWSGLKEEA